MEKSRASPAVGGRGADSLAVYDQQLSRSSCPSGSGANLTTSVGPKSPSNLIIKFMAYDSHNDLVWTQCY